MDHSLAEKKHYSVCNQDDPRVMPQICRKCKKEKERPYTLKYYTWVMVLPSTLWFPP
jgi:hypothetical protein